MKNGITFYLEDFQQWKEAGMTKKDCDDLILGLWHWHSGEPSTEGMSVATKALYLNYINRIEKSEDLSKVRSAIGKKGIMKRWHSNSKNSKANSKSFESDDSKSLPPTPTPTPTPSPTPTPTPTLIKENMGDTPMPPACAVNKKSTRFVKPTEDEVREFCREKGYVKVNAADFIDYYESNGWMVGKNKMKDWRRTVSRWERMDQQGRGGNSAAGNNGLPIGMILHTPENVKEEDYVLG